MGLTRIRAQQISDIDYKQACRAVATTNVTLSGGAPATVDGVGLQLLDRVLVTGQNTASENGFYFVETVGQGENGTWARTTDANETGEIAPGMIVMVTEGEVYADTQWKLTTNGTVIVGTTDLNFVLNAVSVIGGSNTQIQYNAGGTLAGSANLTFANNELAVIGQANVAGNIRTGNILTDGYYYANGEPFAGAGGGGTVTVANTAPVGPSQGDIWIDSDSGIQYLYFNDGDSTQWAEMEALVSISTGSGAVDLSAVDQDIVPAANATYSLGNATNRWANLYLVGNTIDLGGAQIKADAASGAFAFVPAPTDAQPDPVATVISATGGITSVETTGGEFSSNVIAEAAATSSDAVYIFPTQITSNVTVAANTNALSVGPITQSANAVITISSGQRWIIL